MLPGESGKFGLEFCHQLPKSYIHDVEPKVWDDGRSRGRIITTEVTEEINQKTSKPEEISTDFLSLCDSMV